MFYERAVERAARVLDEHDDGLRLVGDEPWFERLDLTALDVASPWNCVLGQLYGHFGLWRSRHVLTHATYDDAVHAFHRCLCASLQHRAWRRAVLRRRRTVAVARARLDDSACEREFVDADARG